MNDLMRFSKLSILFLFLFIFSGCSISNNTPNAPSQTKEGKYEVIERSTGRISPYLLNITNCEDISLDPITEWVNQCELTDGYHDYIYADPDSCDLFLYIPNAPEIFGDIQNKDIEIEVIDNVLKIYVQTSGVTTREKSSGELIIHIKAPLRGAWPNASELFIDEKQIENLTTSMSK